MKPYIFAAMTKAERGIACDIAYDVYINLLEVFSCHTDSRIALSAQLITLARLEFERRMQ
jgi:hypothetical protein